MQIRAIKKTLRLMRKGVYRTGEHRFRQVRIIAGRTNKPSGEHFLMPLRPRPLNA